MLVVFFILELRRLTFRWNVKVFLGQTDCLKKTLPDDSRVNVENYKKTTIRLTVWNGLTEMFRCKQTWFFKLKQKNLQGFENLAGM